MPTVGSTGVSDPLHDSVMRRMSCIRDRAALSEIAQWADQAELSFVRRADFRRELLDWMRLSDAILVICGMASTAKRCP